MIKRQLASANRGVISLKNWKLGIATAMLALVGSSANAANGADVRVKWLGGPTLEIDFGPIKIVTDPVLGEGARAFTMFDPNTGVADVTHARLTPIPAYDFSGVDVVLLSHDHPDHLDEAGLRAMREVPFVAPAPQARALRKRGLTQVTGLSWRNHKEVIHGTYRVSITAVFAQHSADPRVSAQLGQVNGYWLDFQQGSFRRTIYWTGDTLVPAELPPSSAPPDLLVPHLGRVGEGGPFGRVSMGADDAILLARAVKPRAVLPIHHSTFSLYRESISNFATAAKQESWKLELLKEGERLVLP